MILTIFIVCYFRFTLIGHDWGGMVSWFFARFHPGTVLKIILIFPDWTKSTIISEMLDNLILCNLPHPIAFNEARNKSLDQMLKSWQVKTLKLDIDIFLGGYI